METVCMNCQIPQNVASDQGLHYLNNILAIFL